MFKLPVEKLSALFAAVAGKEALYIPADDAAGQANFTLRRVTSAGTKGWR